MDLKTAEKELDSLRERTHGFAEKIGVNTGKVSILLDNITAFAMGEWRMVKGEIASKVSQRTLGYLIAIMIVVIGGMFTINYKNGIKQSEDIKAVTVEIQELKIVVTKLVGALNQLEFVNLD